VRPVELRMDGFGSFREPTVVDFRDTDYFVLVGATGSGKSTVIDAMTFALYGSVPRWDDPRVVGLALAPTASRGTVSLVFELGGARYVAARELRRTASTGKVTVKEARLERLVGEADGETEILAAGARQTTEEVERLLGLPFADFCTCVVLPQGDFADFLHAPTNERQQKLERILGMGVYDRIMRRANAEAATQRSRAELLEQQLGRYADATEQARDEAAARVAELTRLGERVDEAMPALTAARDREAEAQALAARLTDEVRVLSTLRTPEGVAELDRRRNAAAAALAQARSAADSADRARLDAQDRRATGPDRAHLEQVRRDHAEHRSLSGELPTLRGRQSRADLDLTAAARAARAAEEAVERARLRADAAENALSTARQVVETLAAEHVALRGPRLPAGLDDLTARLAVADAEAASSRAAAAAADTAEAEARAAAATGDERAAVEQLRRDHQALAAARTEADRTAGDWEAARKAAEAAVTADDEARHRLHAVRARLAQAERLDLAVVLRPSLTVGDDCPVCAQAVATLPAPLPGTDLDGLRGQVAAAERESGAATRDRGATDTAQSTARAAAERASALVTDLEAAVACRPSAAEATARLAELDRLAEAAATAAEAARGARAERDRAVQRLDEVRATLVGAETELRRARDPLVALGAPAGGSGADRAGPGAQVRADWHTLVTWAQAQAADRAERIHAHQETVSRAVAEQAEADEALAAARRTVAETRAAEADALRAQQQVLSAIDTAQRRLAALAEALSGEPDDAAAEAGLAEATRLADAVRAADLADRSARAALREAEAGAAEVAAELGRAWDTLRAARDPLVGFGAPAAAGDDLPQAWEALTTWAAAAAADRRSGSERAAATAADARADRETRESALVAAFEAVGLSLDTLSAVPARAAAALQQARGALDRIVERRAEVAGLVAERDEATTAHQVAKLLGDQLRSNNFPRWLVASALDVLVVDASESLRELSGGQFELTHDNGDFLVVDHADADARRPVKTLSGGETFQASLALALALSSQLAGLASEGAPRLESIFLDEGFGTLDESNLETVASTLENLATRGDRMVGVITHVPALAERIPVRYSLTRDQRTSRIEREGA